MYSRSANNKPKNKPVSDNLVENLRGVVPPNTISDHFFADIDKDYSSDTFFFEREKTFSPAKPKPKQEFNLFSYQRYYEQELVKRQIKELTDQIKKEVEFIKKANASLLQEVSDIDKLTVEQLPQKPGIYHIRFLELVLKILRALRAKVGESKTWLQALISKKKKRGSLFLARAKKQGTQYSLSQELAVTRSVQ